MPRARDFARGTRHATRLRVPVSSHLPPEDGLDSAAAPSGRAAGVAAIHVARVLHAVLNLACAITHCAAALEPSPQPSRLGRLLLSHWNLCMVYASTRDTTPISGRRRGRSASSPTRTCAISGHENTAEGSVRVSDYGPGTGFLAPSGGRNVGRPLSTMGLRARHFGGRPLRLAWLRCERGSVGVVGPQFFRVVGVVDGGSEG